MPNYGYKPNTGTGMTRGMINMANAAKRQFLKAIKKGKTKVTHTTQGRKWTKGAK